jgi:hypothetical protein
MIRRLTLIVVTTGAALVVAATEGGKTFASPQEARDALIQAAKDGGDALRALFGPGSVDIVRTGDAVQDKNVLETFNRLAAEKTELEGNETDPDQMTLLLGTIEWPFSIPIVRKNGTWYWDIDEGKAEIRRRVIGRNELDAIEICRGYVEAQQTYAETDWDGNGIKEYASKIISTEGKKDGLYWPGDESPVAAGFAKAVAEGYRKTTDGPKPYHGYFYKILMSQGPDAQGGPQDYLVKNLMIGGFALVAWPAEYGVSGIMTFIVNQDGVVYQKNLGQRTGTLAKAITVFNPDKTWIAVSEDTDQ